MNFVDISGFGHSGKSVITDLLREFDGFQVPDYNFEFNLIRIQGGLIDLKHNLIDNWSPIRSDAAINRFRRLIKRIGPSATLSNPISLFLSNGMNYDDQFNGKFSLISGNYIDSLIRYKYTSEWPYPIIEESGLKQFYHRLALKLKLKDKFDRTVNLAVPENFIGLTQKYIDELFGSIAHESTKTIVMHNAIEPFDPVSSLNLFSDCKLIVVQRDPRDIFASIYVKEGVYIPQYEKTDHWRMKRSFLNTNDVEFFIKRQCLLYDKVNLLDDDHRVLRLKYEDIVLNYEETLEKIYRFLKVDKTVHSNKGHYFQPNNSMKNIGIWKKISDTPQIRMIEERMPGYCYNFTL